MNQETTIEPFIQEFERNILSSMTLKESEMLNDQTTPEALAKKDRSSKLPAELAKAGYPLRHIQNEGKASQNSSQKQRGPFWERATTGDFTILLIGARGPGKTQLATNLAAKRFMDGQSPGIYTRLVDLLADIKRTWHDGGRTIGSEQDVLRRYRRTPYLVIDELQEIGGHDWELRYFSNILDHRYGDMLGTVLIGNLTPETVSSVIPASILDRINETGCMIDMSGLPSRRGNQ